jgi:hypothetical protein
MSSTAQTNRLRALLRDGTGNDGDTDRQLARGTLTDAPSPAWPGGVSPATPAASRPCGTPRSGASPWQCARPAARSRPTARSYRLLGAIQGDDHGQGAATSTATTYRPPGEASSAPPP